MSTATADSGDDMTMRTWSQVRSLQVLRGLGAVAGLVAMLGGSAQAGVDFDVTTISIPSSFLAGGIKTAGDLDGDGVVDLATDNIDFSGVSVSILLNRTSQAIPGDLDGDGTVGILDLLNLLSHWG